MLKIAIGINNVAKGIARINRKPYATHFNDKSAVLKSDELIDRINMAAYENSSGNLRVFKFKNLDLMIPRLVIPREDYRQLGMDMACYGQDFKDGTCIVLENSCQSLVSPFVGFDFVSSSLTSYVRGVAYYEHPPYGNYFDSIDKIHVPFDVVAEN